MRAWLYSIQTRCCSCNASSKELRLALELAVCVCVFMTVCVFVCVRPPQLAVQRFNSTSTRTPLHHALALSTPDDHHMQRADVVQHAVEAHQAHAGPGYSE